MRCYRYSPFRSSMTENVRNDSNFMLILGIETSCDETAAAVVEGRGHNLKVLSNVVASQIEIHKKYGGVVPEVAAREHVLNILPVVNEALEKAGVNPLNPPLQGGQNARAPLQKGGRGVKRLDAIAVTVGPGLVTSLIVGAETAKTLAYAWRVPVVAVNHIEGHICANFITPLTPLVRGEKKNKIKFPAVVLTVSGGHTMLVLMSGHGKYKVLGETRADAAGEAFDKAAQLLGLGYPGGPAMAACAAKFKQSITPLIPPLSGGIKLPRPMIRDRNFDFSFSGLKTALFYALRRDRGWRERIPEYAAEFQKAAVEALVAKTIKAAKAFKCRTVMLAGGVEANLELRRELAVAVKESLAGVELAIPELKYCTDNAAMIAAAGYFRARKKDFTPWQKLKTEPNKEFK